ncbi:citryl-CoA lyase [Daeguia caeni]|uniref:citrate synthase (unknown stereospecificity) n=1 Tax=Daeguia caeni TaxID=439612 RepID=A0ABV9HBJ1_9HYPH
MSSLTQSMGTSTATSVTVKGQNLCEDLIGKKSFAEMLYLLVTNRLPTAGQAAALEACLVALMEHGWTPTSMISRLAIDSVPDQVQLAIAAGLLTVGPVFAGTMEGCAAILHEGLQQGITDGEEAARYCDQVVADFAARKELVPGFGHRVHKPVDPRTPAILNAAEAAGVAGRAVTLLKALSAAVDRARGKPITLNATGAIAAVLLDIGIPLKAMRGIAVVSRAGGLLGHIVEEEKQPTAREIWRLTRENIPYAEPDHE